MASGWFRGEGGGLHKFDLPLPAVYARQERAGRLVRVDPPVPAAPAGAPAATPGSGSLERPARSDSKQEWLDYASQVPNPDGLDLGSLSKAELVKEFG